MAPGRAGELESEVYTMQMEKKTYLTFTAKPFIIIQIYPVITNKQIYVRKFKRIKLIVCNIIL